MKMLVETTGDFQLMAPNNELVAWNRPSVVTSTGWLQNHIAINAALVLASPLREDATDAEFVEHLKACDGDVELAVASFVSEAEPVVQPPAKPKRK